MSWDNLPAFVKTTGSPLVSASLRKAKSGQIKVNIFLSAFITDKLGDPKSVNVQIGRDDNAGCLRIAPDDGGSHKVGGGIRGSRCLILPSFDGVPDDAAESFPCQIVTESSSEIILRLPVAEWDREIKLRRMPRPTLPGEPKAPLKAGDKLDMVTYLTNKGVVIKRLAEGRFVVNGDRIGTAEVLELVNSYRQRGDLPPLLIGQVL